MMSTPHFPETTPQTQPLMQGVPWLLNGGSTQYPSEYFASLLSQRFRRRSLRCIGLVAHHTQIKKHWVCVLPVVGDSLNATMNRSRSSHGSSLLNVQSNHSIEDLLSIFEERTKCNTPSSKQSRQKATATTSHAEKIDLDVRSYHPERFPVDVRQKIKLFEKGDCYDSSLPRRNAATKSSSGDLHSLTLHNMVRRNSILFEEWKHSGHRSTRDETSARAQHRQKASLCHVSIIPWSTSTTNACKS